MTLNRSVRYLVQVAGLVALAACSKDATENQNPPPPTDRLTVTLTPDRDSILFGTTRQFSAKVTNQFGIERSVPVDWSSANAAVASVTSTGLVTAVGAGSVQIVAGVTGHADTALVTVYGSQIPLLIVPDAVNLSVGDDITLQASLGDSVAGAGGEVEWLSSDTTLATVAADGTVTGHEAGEVTLTATLGGVSAQAAVTVLAAPVATVTITPAVNSITAGSRTTLRAVARSGTGKVLESATFKWSSSDSTVAVVNNAGVVTGRARGFAIIYAASQGKRGSVSVNVGPPPVTRVVATLPDSSILEGQVLDANASAMDSAGRPISGATIAWQSSNPGIATVTAAGRVTALVAGNVNIIALAGGKTGVVPVVVARRAPTSMSIIPNPPTVGLGGTTQLSGAVLDQNGQKIVGPVISWTSDNPGLATVSSSGLLSGVSAGQANITAASGGLNVRVRATVGAAPDATVSLSPSSTQVLDGDSVAFAPTLKDAGGNVLSGRSIVWTSSNPATATVSSNGVATGVAIGIATITATSEGKSGTATLTVSPTGPLPVASVSVTLNSNTLNVGQTTMASAAVLDRQGSPVSGATVSWGSADPTIASVSAAGLITAIAGGTTTIIASSGGVTGAASITVATPPPAVVASVSIALNPSAIGTGSTAQATVTLRDSAGTILIGRTYGLSSDKPTIATVNVAGVVTGVAAGITNIRASSSGKAGFALLTVSSTAPVVASVSVTAASTLMNVGDTQPATAAALDANGNSIGGRTFTWNSSAPSVISVSASGLLTALAAGSASITATTGGISGSLGFTAQVATANPVATVQLTLGSSALTVAQTTQGVAVLKDAQGNVLTGRTVTYSSSNTAAATVNTTGLVTAVSTGSATISATSGGVSGSANLTVTQGVVATVTVGLPTSMSVGQSTAVVVTLKDAQGNVLTGLPVSYTTSNASVASVSGSGTVTAVATGTASITASSGGKSGAAPVTVLPALPAASALLPQAVPSVPSNLASLACTVNVPSGGLQAALGAARGGSVLCLTGTHQGNFTVPARTDPGWVVIRSAGAIPGGRMRPSISGGLAKLVSNNVLPAIQFSARAVRTLVLGLEITSTPTLTTLAPVSLVQVGSGNEATIGDLPTDIAFQQLYVHGFATTHIRRGFTLNGGAQTIRDSWCDEIHAAGFDSQCSISWNSSGPVLIENNTFKAASEDIMFGGADPRVPGLVTSDITIRKNHITKSNTWKGGGWNVKNLIETKSSARVLVEENVIEGTWLDGQVGYAFVMKSTTQGGGCRKCASSDWTIRRNLIQNAGAGFSIAGRADQHSTGVTDSTNRRFDISENWVGQLNMAPYNGDGRSIIFLDENDDMSVRRNVFEGGNINAATLFDISGPMYSVRNLTMSGNAMARGQYGVFASSTGEGIASWNKAALGSSTWSGMAMVGSTAYQYPGGTTWYQTLTSALNSGAGIARTVIDAGVNGVVQSP